MDPTPPATGPSPLALTPNFYPGPGFVPQPLPFPVIAVSRDVYHPAWWYGIGDPPVGLPQPTPHVPLQAYPPRFALVPNAANGGAKPATANDQGGQTPGQAHQESAVTPVDSSTPPVTPALATTDNTKPQDISPPAATAQKRQASTETEQARPEQKKARPEVQISIAKKQNKKKKKKVLAVATALPPDAKTKDVASAAQPSTCAVADGPQQSINSQPSDTSISPHPQPAPSFSESATPSRPLAPNGSLTPTAKPSAEDIAMREQQLRAQLKTKWSTPKESYTAITQVKQEPPETPVRSSFPSPPPLVQSQASLPPPQKREPAASPPPVQIPSERQPHDVDTPKKPLAAHVETPPSIFRSIFSRWRPITEPATDPIQATKEETRVQAAPTSAPGSPARKAKESSPAEVVERGVYTTGRDLPNVAVGDVDIAIRKPGASTAQASRKADSCPSPPPAALTIQTPAEVPSDDTEEDMQISPIESTVEQVQGAPVKDGRPVVTRAGSEALVLREILGDEGRAPATNDAAAAPPVNSAASGLGKLEKSTPPAVQTDPSLTKAWRDGSKPLVINLPTSSTAPQSKANDKQIASGKSAPNVPPASGGVPPAKSVPPPVSEPKGVSSSQAPPRALPASAAPKRVSPTVPAKPVMAAVASEQPTAAKSAESSRAPPTKLSRHSTSQPISQAIGKGKQPVPTRQRSPQPYSSPLPEPANFRPMKKPSLATRLYWEDDHYSPHRPLPRRPRSPSLSPPLRGRPPSTRPRSPSISPPPSFRRADAARPRSDLKGSPPFKAAEPGSSSTKPQQPLSSLFNTPSAMPNVNAKPALLQRIQTDGLPVQPPASSLAQIRAGAGVPPKPTAKGPAVWSYSPPPSGSNSSFAKLVLAQSAPAQPSLSSRISGHATAPTSGQSG